jgi:hypothetical protein
LIITRINVKNKKICCLGKELEITGRRLKEKMPVSDYKKNFVTNPILEFGSGIKGRQSPVMMYMSNTLVPGCNKYLEISWIYGIPEPNPHMQEHTHNYDEIVLHLGSDAANPQDLGATIDYYVGGQPLAFDTTSSIFIPNGVRHGPVVWRKFSRPHLEISIILGPDTNEKGWSPKGKKALPQTKDPVEYEKYIVRKPAYLQGTEVTNALKSPAGIYVSSNVLLGCKNYIDFGWITETPDPNPPIPLHDHDFEEIVLNLGNDPNNPQDLGADVEFCIDNQCVTFNKTCATYIPRGIPHGPMTWKKINKPNLLMPIIFGAGTLMEAGPAGYKGK